MNRRPRVLDELGAELLRVGDGVLNSPPTHSPVPGRHWQIGMPGALRGMGGVLSVVVSAAVAIAVVAVALTAHGSSTSSHHPGGLGVRSARLSARRVLIQATYTQRGTPLLVANADVGSLPPTWLICRPSPGDRCMSTSRSGNRVGTADHVRSLNPGPEPVGTTFQAVVVSHGHRYVSQTRQWLGDVHVTARPLLHGQPLVGSTVVPTVGSWAGGWGRDVNILGVEACRSRNAEHCSTLSIAGGGFESSHKRAVITMNSKGWYLFAVNRRYARQAAFALPGYRTARAIPPAAPGATVAFSTPLGPIRTG